jgi:predicted Zn-dependent protease with MMP-like domain
MPVFQVARAKSQTKEVQVTREEFRALVDEALLTIPDEFREAMRNIAIVVEDAPSPRALAEVGLEPPETLLGLYEGIPLTERQWAHGNVLPDKVTLFQAPIEESSESREDTIVAIGETLIHEIGHYFGLSEEEIEEIEDRYWHSTEATEEGPEDAERRGGEGTEGDEQ